MGARLEQRLVDALKKVAPGTELREALERIISARTGALIVVGDTKNVMPLCDGGFGLGCEFIAQKLFELAKMDGAIIMDEDMTRILRANVHLVPDSSLPTSETGMRHRTAERVAKQTKALVISISQRRDVVSLYIDDMKYVLADIRVILAKANQALQTLERYKIRLDQVFTNLNTLELEDLVTLQDVANLLQRSEMVERVAGEIERYINELGAEGRLIEMQMEELMAGVREDTLMAVGDYCLNKRAERAKSELAKLSSEDLLDFLKICRILGYEGDPGILDLSVHPRGYRLLRKIPRLPIKVAKRIVSKFGNLQGILQASIEDLDVVEGVGAVRAKAIWEGLKRIKEHSFLERYV